MAAEFEKLPVQYPKKTLSTEILELRLILEARRPYYVGSESYSSGRFATAIEAWDHLVQRRVNHYEGGMSQDNADVFHADEKRDVKVKYATMPISVDSDKRVDVPFDKLGKLE